LAHIADPGRMGMALIALTAESRGLPGPGVEEGDPMVLVVLMFAPGGAVLRTDCGAGPQP
jgi:hypothetical protein